MLSLLTLVASVAALNPIVVRDNVFYDAATNQRFFMKGVDYQPGGASAVEAGKDPLSDISICLRDVAVFQKLGLNTVRVYSVDNALNHDACMSLYDAAGIYLILDVNSPLEGQYLNRDTPYITYNSIYAEHVFKTITVFGGYRNTLGFFSGNELINSDVSALASPPYVKAITRDMKAYIRAHLTRPIPVGYSAADDIKYRQEIATYMSCGTDSDGVNDFYAINSYQWCGQQTIQSSGYDQLIAGFSNFTLPLFFSEYGCNEVRPRSFGEVGAIYGSQMTPKFSGGLVYEYTQEANNYGLVNVSSDGAVAYRADYVAFSSQLAQATGLPTSIPATQGAYPTCPPASAYTYLNGSRTLPSLEEVNRLIRSGVSARAGTITPVSLPTSGALAINDQNGNAVANKQITQASSSGTVGNLASLFGSNTGSALQQQTGSARATGSSSASTTARSSALKMGSASGALAVVSLIAAFTAGFVLF
ncbi:Glucanosyltransferase-domain-containing protein [Protomyces lactucae-debilis]|uniref:1,3-beta-glucanosyltransferase n=1 Tax=Protomyces lactucae-debilis TaxID=2754530 RepID=A0A1Y2FLA3_PROLT|nr:Glucanosyltransferase-domain-containing protein [Protomyces lactucae-debilis]ORY84772.1 Glucanosyltransferase-domain-containing protein [Protomyces lactucae-debilis]